MKSAVRFTADMDEEQILSTIKEKFIDKFDGNVPPFKILKAYGTKLVSPNLDGKWTYKVLKHQCGNGPLYVCSDTIKVSSDSEDELLYEPFETAMESRELPQQQCTQQQSAAATATVSQEVVTCPICEQKVPTTEIQVHANNCAELYSDIKDDDYATIVWDVTPEVIPEDSGSDYEVEVSNECNMDGDIKKLRSTVQEDVSMLRKEETEFCHLNIRRLKAWRDYVSFFKKPWNKHKSNDEILVTFLGEAAVDTGGPRREFFSGES